MENVFASSFKSRNEDEEALSWAAIERLPTYTRLRTSLFKSLAEDKNQGSKLVDVRKLNVDERNEFIERNFKVPEEDNEKFFRKLRDRIDK